ncbi:hypothetical protein [Marinobacter mobilis]|uniref:Outer membrane protein beta-barrel domain-containing protein n=1 Tax=Marinobacter mobilis TaxID=488533 RepID=A0A1H2SJ85_9GAMM|nr:hypothetical protein [Marinobacter mobilis]SDW31642.1 hypothetical protein SAMN04487960_102145 [Marinobacter mobilis]
MRCPLAALLPLFFAPFAAAEEGELYLFHNVYTNHLGDSTYFFRAYGEGEYEEDNNATGLRYKLTDRFALGAGYTPDNSYHRSSVILAAEYAWPLPPYLELGAMIGSASGYEILEHEVNGWTLQFGPLVRVGKGWFAVSGILLNLDILVVNAELRIWQF